MHSCRSSVLFSFVEHQFVLEAQLSHDSLPNLANLIHDVLHHVRHA